MQANWPGLSITQRTNLLLSVAKRSSPAKFNSSEQTKIDRINHVIFSSIKSTSSFFILFLSYICMRKPFLLFFSSPHFFTLDWQTDTRVEDVRIYLHVW